MDYSQLLKSIQISAILLQCDLIHKAKIFIIKMNEDKTFQGVSYDIFGKLSIFCDISSIKYQYIYFLNKTYC